MTRLMSLLDLLSIMTLAFEAQFDCTFDIWKKDPEDILEEDDPPPLFDVHFGHPDANESVLTLRVYKDDTFLIIGDLSPAEHELLIFSEVLRNAHDLMGILQVEPVEVDE